jgi:cell wall-associated NlpC family hydrolase
VLKKQIICISAVIFLLSSCAQQHQGRRYSVRRQIEIRSLLEAAEYWLKTPYRYGGNNERGIDCSGLVCAVYREVYGIRLPRSTSSQRRLGSSVRTAYTRPGDLLFFRMKRRGPVDHVGIYLGGNDFIHASSSRGVVISSLRDPYYSGRLVTARRIRR